MDVAWPVGSTGCVVVVLTKILGGNRKPSVKLSNFTGASTSPTGFFSLATGAELAFSSKADGFLELGNAIKDFGGSEDVSSSASRAGDVLVP